MTIPRLMRSTLLAATLAALAGCGGGGDSADPGQPPPPPATIKIGGTVSGLTGTMVLRDNGADDLNVAGDGPFTFATLLATGAAYSVSVATQPANQSCAVTNGSGTTGSANVTNVSITCSAVVTAPSALSYPSPQTYAAGEAITPINPTVTGTVANFSVAPALPAGITLNTGTGQISGTPSAETAAADYVITATNSAGSTTFSLSIAVSAAPTDFTIGGTVTGLRATGLVLRNNGGNDLAVTVSGAVTFSSRLADQARYSVTVKTQPVLPAQFCTVTNGSGAVAGANVINVTVNCVGSGFTDTDRDGLTDEVEATLGTDPTNVDTDGDTVGDGEEAILRHSNPLSKDSDGDTVSDDLEIANGTGPDKFDTDGDGLDDGVDPYPWRADGDGDGVSDVLDPNPLVRDTDGDRVLDGLEAGRCNPLDADSDDDTVKDGTERAAGMTCDQPDSDHDGLADNEEVGPTVADQDGDGLIDGVEERVYHSLPGVQDTDNDGLNDGDEVKLHRTDPISADTDCDGVKDGLEVLNGTDPLHGPGGGTCSL